MMKNIKIMWVVIAAVLLMMDIPQAQVQTWNSWKNWQTEVSGLINTSGLVLFVDPGHQIIGGEQNNSYNTLTYGSELVFNPNFSDFTFPGRHSDNFTNNWSNNIDDDTTFSAEVNSSPTFSAVGNWVIRGNWSVASDSLLHAAGATIDTAAHGHTISAGETAKIYAEISVFADTLFMKLGNTVIDTFAVSDTVHKELTLTNTDSFYLIANAAFDGGVDTLSLVEKYEGIVADWKLIDQYQTDKSHYLVGNRYAAKFDGESSYLSFSDITVDKDSATIAFTAYVAPDNVEHSPLLGNSGTDKFKWISYYNASSLYVESNTNNNTSIFSNINNTEEVHYLLTFESGVVTLYEDGVGRTKDNGVDLTNDITFDRIGAGLDEYWKGFIKDLQIWSKPLSSAERTQVLNGTIPSDSLVANWQFDNPDTWLLDQSGNGHDLTNSGVELVHGNAGFIGQDWARGGALKDTSGNLLNGYHLTAHNGILDNTYNEASPTYSVGYAQEFDGIDDYLSLPAAQAVDFNPGVGDFSWSFWVYSDDYDAANTQAIISKFENGDNRFYLYFNADGRFSVYSKDAGSVVLQGGQPSKTVTNGSWHHISIIFNRTSTIDLYVDASQVTFNTTACNEINLSNDGDLRIGNYDGSAWDFTGHISDITYHNRALSANEVKELYAEPPSWNWNENSSIGKSGFAVTLGSTDTLSQTISTTDGYLYEADTNSVNYDYANEDDYNLQIQNGTFTSTSVKQVTNATWTDVTTVQNYAATSDSGSMKNSMETAQPLHPTALWFDGVDDYADFGDICDVGTSDFILWGWVDGGSNGWLNKRNATNGYDIAFNNLSRAIRVYLDWGTTTSDFRFGGSSMPDSWTMVSFVFDRSDNLRVFLNLNEATDSPEDISTKSSDSFSNDANFLLGKGYGFSVYDESIGLFGIYIFDGQNGRPSSLPADYETSIIEYNYNNTRAELVRLGIIQE